MAWLQYSDVMWERPEMVSRRGEHRADVRVASALGFETSSADRAGDQRMANRLQQRILPPS